MKERQTCDLLIHDTYYLNENLDVVPDCSIAVSAGRILDVLPAADALLHYAPKELVAGRHKLWMPGLIDGHMHTGQQLLKGKVLDQLPMIWTRIMLPFESTLTPEKMELSSQLAALEMIKAGTAGFLDAGSYHMETAAKVYAQSGLRGALSHSTMDQGKLPDSITQSTREALESTDHLYERFHGQGNLSIFYSLRSLISCSPELIEGTFARAKEKETFVQAHMNEYPNEINFFLERYQLRPLEYLAAAGVLMPDFVCAHSILLSEREMDIMAEHRLKAVHCPFSNCGKGVPNTPALLNRGITVGLGTDGAAHGGLSLWHEMKIFRAVMMLSYGVPASNPVIMPAKTILAMATRQGAALMGQEKQLGIIKKGFLADMISINLDQPHLYPSQNLTNTLFECVGSGDVEDMLVGGKWVMKHRRVLTLDEEKILAAAKAVGHRGII